MPLSTLARIALLPAAALLLPATGPAHAAPVAATVENGTTTTACAEEDNVSLTLRGEGIRRMRIEAQQPDYLDKIGNDVTAPDFSGCNFDGGEHPTDPAYRFRKRTVVLMDNAQWRVVGMTLPSFWRPPRCRRCSRATKWSASASRPPSNAARCARKWNAGTTRSREQHRNERQEHRQDWAVRHGGVLCSRRPCRGNRQRAR